MQLNIKRVFDIKVDKETYEFLDNLNNLVWKMIECIRAGDDSGILVDGVEMSEADLESVAYFINGLMDNDGFEVL